MKATIEFRQDKIGKEIGCAVCHLSREFCEYICGGSGSFFIRKNNSDVEKFYSDARKEHGRLQTEYKNTGNSALRESIIRQQERLTTLEYIFGKDADNF